MKDEIKDKIIDIQSEYIEELSQSFENRNYGRRPEVMYECYRKYTHIISDLKSQLSEAYKDCIYRNEEGGCWAIKLKCDPRNENCDYRKEEKLSEAGKEKPIIKKCRQCRFFDLDEHCEPCESCYPIAYSNWQPR